MIAQKILKLVKDSGIPNTELKFEAGTEFEIVADVVYIGGYPLPPNMQPVFYDWLTTNMSDKKLFKEDFRRF